MMWQIVGWAAGSIIAAEVLLRLASARTKALDFDVSDYPFYTRPKNAQGKDHYNVLRRGKKQTPIITTGEHGIRGVFPDDKRKAVLVAGCSFTEGAGLKDEETFPGYLQQFLGGKSAVVNAGMSGYGLFQIEHLVKRFLPHHLDIVIVQLLDFKRVPLDFERIAKARKELLTAQQIKRWSHLLCHFWKLKHGRSGIRSAYMFRNVPKERLWEENKKHLRGIVASCRDAKVPVVFFIWPVKDQALFHHDYFYQQLQKFAKEQKITMFDARNLQHYYTDAQLQLDHDTHPSALANKLVAKAAYHCLVEKKLI